MNSIRVEELSSLKVGESGRVESIRTRHSAAFQELLAAGLIGGARLDVLQSDGRHMLVVIGSRELALDRETAAQICVRVNR